MFIAKHAKWAGGLHPEDGNHALYHVEVREMLKGLGLNLVARGQYEACSTSPTSTSSSRCSTAAASSTAR
jgi:D-alanine-D-alanine ligase